MTEGEAVAEAERAASAAGYRPEEYVVSGVTSADRGWRIEFQQRPPARPGGHFTARVRSVGDVSIIHGR